VKKLFERICAPQYTDLGLLLFRLVIGVNLFLKHAWFKVALFGNPEARFPDPFHLGVQLTVAIAFLSDGVGSILVILGLLTRPATLFMACNLAVAWGMVYHFNYFAPAPATTEELALYLGGVIALFFSGPGRLSLDAKLWGRTGA
jgi:putative oxidoreductase